MQTAQKKTSERHSGMPHGRRRRRRRETCSGSDALVVPPCTNCNPSMCRLEPVSSSGINSSDKRMQKRRRNGGWGGVITTSSPRWKDGVVRQSDGCSGEASQSREEGRTHSEKCVRGRQSEGDSGVHFVSAAPPCPSLLLPPPLSSSTASQLGPVAHQRTNTDLTGDAGMWRKLPGVAGREPDDSAKAAAQAGKACSTGHHTGLDAIQTHTRGLLSWQREA